MASTEDPRFRISAARRILHRSGLDSQIGGQVTMRAPGEDAFYATPLQYFDETLPEHVSKVSFDLTVIEPGTLPTSSAIAFHAAVYEAMPHIGSVIHTHSANVIALSSGVQPFGIYHDYASIFVGGVGTFTDVPGLTARSEAQQIAAAIGDRRAVIMKHHGAINVGERLEDVTVEAIVLELCAGYQLAARAVDGVPLDEATAESYDAAYVRSGFREQMWNANLRRLRRSDPDLFECLSEEPYVSLGMA